MTTLVTVSPHPVPGLRVEVEIQHNGDPKRGRVEVMRNGEVPRQFAATDDMTIIVREVKDVPREPTDIGDGVGELHSGD